jgi:hypothetical protein
VPWLAAQRWFGRPDSVHSVVRSREIYRTDWMRIIRRQAFVDLWLKAHQTYGDGLMVVRAMGTDERPVIDRRLAGGVPRGPRCHRVKVKDQYTVGTDADTDD